MMTKIQILKISNMALFISFVVQALTSLVMFFEIEALEGPIVFQVHKYNGLLMIALVMFHVALHWPAVKGLFFRKT